MKDRLEPCIYYVKKLFLFVLNLLKQIKYNGHNCFDTLKRRREKLRCKAL